MRLFKYFAAAAAVFLGQAATAGCYVVYDTDQQIIYRAPEPPVDLSRQLHETLPLVAPGGMMVFSMDHYGCDLTINKLPTLTQAPRKAPSQKTSQG